MTAAAAHTSARTAPGAPSPTTAPLAAERYWRLACALAATHVLGTTWPPPGQPQRSRIVGHWGCNPGIAWIVGHLAAHWAGREPLLLVLGTGHATSFAVAHEALRERWAPALVSATAARYGRPGGEPSEIVGAAGVPYLGGELGPALAVAQGLAAGLPPGRMVACVVGDGECETPAALAALAHAPVLLGSGAPAAWLPVVNANGARMGGASRFGPRELQRLLGGLGYRVVTSSAETVEASEAARAALDAALAGEPVAWVSVTDKGWPAPALVGGRPFRGSAAHKPRGLDPGEQGPWVAALVADLLAPTGELPEDVTALSRRVTLRCEPPASTRSRAVPHERQPIAGTDWAPPVAAVDEVLAARESLVLSPDEAESNGLRCCLRAGLVREVLAEEVCAAWTWGLVEAGREAVLASYEAFAPLVGSLVAQYAKLVHTRPRSGLPPLTVLLSSLGWANAPTHQNSDLVATVLGRPWPRMRLVCPLGATSAALRVDALLHELSDGIGVVIASKQPLLDLPDPGGAAVDIAVAGGPPPAATVLAVGDVCVTEAVAAMTAAASAGIGLRVVAVVEPRSLDPRRSGRPWSSLASAPLIGSAWCPPAFVKPFLWEAVGGIFPVLGYQERWGPTPWETLRSNRLDRVSLLEQLAAEGAGIPPTLVRKLRRTLDRRAAAGTAAGTQPFTCPPLRVSTFDPSAVPAPSRIAT